MSAETRDFSFKSAVSVALRVTLLFGLMAVALVLIIMPGVEHRPGNLAANELDMTITGSIRPDNGHSSLRVFQPAPRAQY